MPDRRPAKSKANAGPGRAAADSGSALSAGRNGGRGTRLDGRDVLISQIQQCRKLRPERRHNVVHAVLDYTDDWGSRYTVKEVTALRKEDEVLVHIKTNHPEPSGWPWFLRFRADAKAYSNNTGAGLTRKWCLDEGYVTGSGYQKVRV